MVAIVDPDKLDAFRQRKRLDFAAASERIAFALDDQRRAFERFQMGRAQLFRNVWRMKRISEANEAGDFSPGVELATRPPRDLPPITGFSFFFRCFAKDRTTSRYSDVNVSALGGGRFVPPVRRADI